METKKYFLLIFAAMFIHACLAKSEEVAANKSDECSSEKQFSHGAIRFKEGDCKLKQSFQGTAPSSYFYECSVKDCMAGETATGSIPIKSNPTRNSSTNKSFRCVCDKNNRYLCDQDW